jgi:hypothetical protein
MLKKDFNIFEIFSFKFLMREKGKLSFENLKLWVNTRKIMV